MKKAKVLLIDSHYRKGINGPNIGLAYIAASIKPLARIHAISFHISNDNISYNQFKKEEKDFFDEIKKIVLKNSFDIVGITGSTGTYPRMLRIATTIKKNSPNSLITFGGPHVTILESTQVWKNQIFKDTDDVDILVRGEGEDSFREIIEQIIENNKKDFSRIKGISFRIDDKNIIRTEDRQPNNNLDKLRYPAWDVFDLNLYPKVFYVGASRGCKYRCAFCDEKNIFSKYVVRKVDSIIEEIKRNIKEFNVRCFRFSDSCLTSYKYLELLCDSIIKEKLNIKWIAYGRINEVNSHLLKKMKEAGCVCIYYGIESGSNKILKAMNKGINKEKVNEIIDLTKKSDILIKGSFIIGFPGETKETALETIEFAKSLNLNIINWHTYTPDIKTINEFVLKNPTEKIRVNWKRLESDMPMRLINDAIRENDNLSDMIYERHTGNRIDKSIKIENIDFKFTTMPFREICELIQIAIGETKQNASDEWRILKEMSEKQDDKKISVDN